VTINGAAVAVLSFSTETLQPVNMKHVMIRIDLLSFMDTH